MSILNSILLLVCVEGLKEEENCIRYEGLKPLQAPSGAIADDRNKKVPTALFRS